MKLDEIKINEYSQRKHRYKVKRTWLFGLEDTWKPEAQRKHGEDSSHFI